MKRLVKNGKIILDGTLPLYEKEKLVNAKLEAIEDVEEELGIDILLYLKVMKNGFVWIKGKEPEWADLGTKKDIKKYWVCYFSKENLYVQFGKDCSEHCIDNPLLEYGKTWALTKEELE